MKTDLDLLEWSKLLELLADHAETPLGRARATRLRPLARREALEETCGAVREALGVLGAHAGRLLAGAEDLGPILRAGHRNASAVGGAELWVVARTLRAASSFAALIRRIEPGPILRSRVDSIPNLSELQARLERSVDRDGKVLDEASEELAELRRRRGEEEQKVRLLADRIAGRSELRAVLRQGPPVLRDGRLMLAVRAESRGNVQGVLHDRSASGNTVFVEPRELVEPQNRLADLRARERNVEARVLLELTRELLRREGEIHELGNVLGSLDLIFARARYGRLIQGHLAAITESGPLVLRQARHPLLLDRAMRSPRTDADAELDLASGRRAVVPFDLELGEEFDVLVVTGPNTGGKTVTLKTAGIVCLMALAAVPVPASSGSQVPFFDGVFADIGDEQDLQQNLSTFSGHLRRIRRILERATRRSLVLLDELGTGTDPQEGEALGHALLRSLLERRARVVATTHLSGLKEMGFAVERVENASLEFDPTTLKPLYRLTVGLPGESNALTIARRLGLEPDVIRAAEARLHRGSGDEGRRAREAVQKSRNAALRRLEVAEEEARKAEALRAELEGRLDEVRRRAEVLDREKEKEIERLLEDVRGRGLALVEEFGTVPSRLAPVLERLMQFLEDLPSRSDLAERRASRLAALLPGESVYLPRYRERCRIRKIDRGRKTITVVYRNMAMEVPFQEVEVPEAGLEP